MQKLIYLLSLILFGNYTILNGQDRVFKYHTENGMGGDYEIKLTLKENKDFLFSEIDDQICYVNESVSLGRWEQEGQNIMLKVSDTLQPKVKIKDTFLKKDTLTIFFTKMDDCSLIKKFINRNCSEDGDAYTFDRDIHFYDKNNKEIFIDGLQNKGVIEIPIDKTIDKIDFYFPNDWSPNSAKISVNISENIGQIHISNLSRYLQTNFAGYTFDLKKEYILMSGFRLDNLKLKLQQKDGS